MTYIFHLGRHIGCQLLRHCRLHAVVWDTA
jgi:hypothetical protein